VGVKELEDVVLFMSGIYWRPRRIRKRKFRKLYEQQVKEVLAAGDLEPFVAETSVEGENGELVLEYLRMTPCLVGDVGAQDDDYDDDDVDDAVPMMKFYDYEDAPSDTESDSGGSQDEESDG
jgi:hypothetical protein